MMGYNDNMFVATIPNRKSPPAILLREGYREHGKMKMRTLANLSHWPTEKLETFKQALEAARGKRTVGVAVGDALEIVRTRPHGHVAAVLGTLKRIGLDQKISSKPHWRKNILMAMIVARVIDPASKLATVRGFHHETLFNSLGEILQVENATEDDLYEAMDWLLERQPSIEAALARAHLEDATLLLYDTSSTYFEGRTCPLAHFGHNRDGKKDKLQIVFGLLCTKEGCPIAVEVFDGNTADPKTLASQLKKVQERFKLKRVVWVGDRGLLTEARITEEFRTTEGIGWITALRAPAIAELMARRAIQLSLFDEHDLAEISAPLYPDERLIVCRNPLLAKERARKRSELLAATEAELSKITEATTRPKNRLVGEAEIGVRVGKVLGKYKMGKHFAIEITESRFSFTRNEESIARESLLDGIYVIRTSVPKEELTAEAVVRTYKGLSVVERAFRSLKTMDLKIRPIHHRLGDRVRAHVFLCMLSYYVEWHMRKALAPILFEDDEPASREALRASVVAPSVRSVRARKKAGTKRTEEGTPVHSFQTLLKDLQTVAKNRVKPGIAGAPSFDVITTPTSLQQRAFDLLGVSHRM